MQPRARAQGWQAKLGTESSAHLQPPTEAPALCQSSAWRHFPPLPFLGHASSPWRKASLTSVLVGFQPSLS